MLRSPRNAYTRVSSAWTPQVTKPSKEAAELCGPHLEGRCLQLPGRRESHQRDWKDLRAGWLVHSSIRQAGRGGQREGSASIQLPSVWHRRQTQCTTAGLRGRGGHGPGRKDPSSGRNSMLRSPARHSAGVGGARGNGQCRSRVWSSLPMGGVQGRAQDRTGLLLAPPLPFRDGTLGPGQDTLISQGPTVGLWPGT